MATPVQQESAYIYCILLPFQCTPATVVLDRMLRPGRHLSPPQSVCRVAKVGITTRNPADRLYEIFSAFEKLGEPQPQSLLLRILSEVRYSDPQTAVTILKTKMINEIIFIESVHTPESAEKDICTKLQTGEYNLPQEFFYLI